MRNTTLDYDKKMGSQVGPYEQPALPSENIINWLKTNRPDLYAEMQDGIEIGFKKISGEYKQFLKQKDK